MAPRSERARAITKKHIARLERERRQTRIIVIGAGIVVAFVLGMIGYYFLNERVIAPLQPVAKVGADKITTEQFQERVRLQRQQVINQYIQYYQFSQMFGMDFTAQLQQFEMQLSEAGAESLGQGVLDSMINEILLRQEAEKLGFTASEEEVQARIHEVFGYFPDGEPIPSATPTEVVMPTISAAQARIVTITPTPSETPLPSPTGMTTPTLTLTPDLTTTATATIEPTATITPSATPAPTQTATPGPTNTPEPTATPLGQEGFDELFLQSMESFAQLGYSEADYRDLVVIDILNSKLYDYVTADMKPFEEQVWARHILVEDEETANGIYQRLMDGEDFAELAAEFSTDPGSKDTGGDLGWFGKGQMVEAFEMAAFSQKPGEIGKPVQSDYGWHIIQVIGHEERPLTAEQFQLARETAYTQWIDDLRAKAEEAGLIEIFDYWKERVPLDPDLASAAAAQ